MVKIPLFKIIDISFRNIAVLKGIPSLTKYYSLNRNSILSPLPFPVQRLDSAYLGGALSCRICRFPDTHFLDLVVQGFLMLFMIGLFAPVFSQYMRPFNYLLMALAATQPVLMRHCGHNVDKHVLEAVIRARVIGSACEGSLSDNTCHDVGTFRLTIRSSCCSVCFFRAVTPNSPKQLLSHLSPLGWEHINEGPSSISPC